MVVSMGMLGFVYLVLILGWIFIVLLLKCKKSLTNFNNMYTEPIGSEHQPCPSVHVIHLQAEDLESEEQFMNNNNNHNAQHQLHNYHPYQLARTDSIRRLCRQCNNSSNTTCSMDAIVNDNAAYTYDDDEEHHHHDNNDNTNNNTPPPSYEEVMRRSEIYLKMHQTSTNTKLKPTLTAPN